MTIYIENRPIRIIILFALLLVAVLALVLLASKDEFNEYGVSEDEYKEILNATDSSTDPTGDPSADCPFKLSRDQWATLQSQYERTPPMGEVIVTGEHYILINLLNRWKIFPNSAEEALAIAEFLLTYCLED